MAKKLIVGGTCLKGHVLSKDTIYIYPPTSKQAGIIRCSICKQIAKDKSRGTSRIDFIMQIPTKDRTHCPSGHPYDEENTYITKANKRNCKACSRERDYMSKYGITIKDYENMLYEQDGLCAICKSTSYRRLCVDHNHETGAVRQLLCDNCNTGIARFYENIEALESAIEYLRKHNQLTS